MTEVKIHKTENEQAFSLQYPYDWNQDGQIDEVTVTFNQNQPRLFLLGGTVRVCYGGQEGPESGIERRFQWNTDQDNPQNMCDPWRILTMKYSPQTDLLELTGQKNGEESFQVSLSSLSEKVFITGVDEGQVFVRAAELLCSFPFPEDAPDKK